MKKFFGIEKSYCFESADLRALFTILNVVGVIVFGLVAAWIGLAMAIADIICDFKARPHINVWVIHIALLVLNGYFLGMLYQIF